MIKNVSSIKTQSGRQTGLPDSLMTRWRYRSLLGTIGPGFVLALILSALALICLGTLGLSGIGQFRSDLSPIWPILVSGSIQAGLSTVFSLIFGVLAALALHHYWQNARGYWQAKLITTLLHLSLLAMVLPTTVAAAGLLGVFGRAGFLADFSSFLFGQRLTLPYGLWLVVLAHGFFNAPLVMRVYFAALSARPAHHDRQSAQMGLSFATRFRWLYWPVLKPLLPGVIGLVFLLCFSSFALVLMLGGGPRVTTLELAIYTALRFEYNLPYAAQLALIQWAVCLAIIGLLARHAPAIYAPLQADRQPIGQQSGVGEDTLRFVILCLYGGFIGVPMVILACRFSLAGLSLFTWPVFWQAARYSLSIAVLSAVLSVMMGFAISYALYSLGRIGRYRAWSGPLARFIQLSAHLYLCLPAILLGSAAFLLLFRYMDVEKAAFWLVILANALFGLPFALRMLQGRLSQILNAQERSMQMMGLGFFKRMRSVILPAMRVELGAALILIGALSFGDFGLIALFGSSEMQTLPYLMYSLLNRYGGPEADMLALVMAGIILVSLWGFQLFLTQLGKRRAIGAERQQDVKA